MFPSVLLKRLSAKPRDIKFPAPSDLSIQPPFVFPGDEEAKNVANQATGVGSSLDPTTVCSVHSEIEKCKYGFKCRFLGAHVKVAGDDFSDELSFVVDGDMVARAAVSAAELNFIDPDVRKQVCTRKMITFHPPLGHNPVDRLHCGAMRFPSNVDLLMQP